MLAFKRLAEHNARECHYSHQERTVQSCPKVAGTWTAGNSSALVFPILKKKEKEKRNETKRKKEKEGREGKKDLELIINMSIRSFLVFYWILHNISNENTLNPMTDL